MKAMTLRTTLTLDADVAKLLERLRDERNMNFREVVNTALRKGLDQMSAPERGQKRLCRTPVFHAERTALGELTSVSDMLAVAEGEGYA
jgi:hypothetical protein